MTTKPSWSDHVPSLSDDPTHPAQIALRTYVLALALSLGPSLIPFVTAPLTEQVPFRNNLTALKRILRRELGHDGFAFAITLSIGGGVALQHIWDNFTTHSIPVFPGTPHPVPETTLQGTQQGKSPQTNASPGAGRFAYRLYESVMNPAREKLRELGPEQRAFVANVVASSAGVFLLQVGRERATMTSPRRKFQRAKGQISPTLDLTLLLVVRALDSLLQTFIHKQYGRDVKGHQRHSAVEARLVKDLLDKEIRRRRAHLREKLSSRLDAFVFWACSARLPRSYVKWINTLANVDPRLLKALSLRREGKWGYIDCNPNNVDLLKKYATDLGRPESWGDPTMLPAYGGKIANTIWKTLGVTSRPGVGGLPCEIVHGSVGGSLGLSHSCLANTSVRGIKAFMDAITIYIPAHFLPVLMTRPKTLIRPHRFIETFLGAVRSATFLSTFVASYWLAVCFTRSLVLAKLLPSISHNFWDGHFGCMLVGSLVSGSSIWIENGKRRGEMALYVMPKALRVCLPDSWIKGGGRRTKIVERILIILSVSTLLTAAVHRPESLRGLSRWTLSFIINGPNAGFWRRKRRDPSIPPTPSYPPTSVNGSALQTPGLSRSQTPNPSSTRILATNI